MPRITETVPSRLLAVVAAIVAIFCIWQPFSAADLALYDFNFWLRSPEPTDNRLTIIEWDENSIQLLDETTMSDDVLVSLLSKLGNKPAVIGLDLFRDVPVFSPRISDEANLKAYNDLKQIFQTSTNLVGIKKTIEPKVNPPLILDERGVAAASDVPSERDNLIRRSYIYPQEDESGNPAGVPYIGVALGYQYLENQGWSASQGKGNTLIVSKENEAVAIQPINNFVGIPPKDPHGFYFLVNWRKSNSYSCFKKVSVVDVINNRYDLDSFNNKIILIGNTSVSTADKHYLPSDRWSDDSLAYGVEIPAQVASSIVAAAIDGRPLIVPSSKIWELVVVIFTCSLSFLFVARYYGIERLFSMSGIFFKTFIWAAAVSLLLIISNIILFNFGIWLAVSNAVFGVWFTCFCLCYCYYFKVSKENQTRLYLFVKNIDHSLGTPIASLRSSTQTIEKSLQYLIKKHQDDYETIDELSIIHRKEANITKNIRRIEQYKTRLRNFVDLDYRHPSGIIKIVRVNQYVNKLSQSFLEMANPEYHVDLIFKLDPKIGEVKIDSEVLDIVLTNLLDNALYAVKPYPGMDYSSNSKITISTHLKQRQNKIEFEVADNGPGILPKYQKNIFEPFVSYRHSSGSGLGLYIVKGFLSLCNSKIKLESSSNGSKFSFDLPYE